MGEGPRVAHVRGTRSAGEASASATGDGRAAESEAMAPRKVTVDKRILAKCTGNGIQPQIKCSEGCQAKTYRESRDGCAGWKHEA